MWIFRENFKKEDSSFEIKLIKKLIINLRRNNEREIEIERTIDETINQIDGTTNQIDQTQNNSSTNSDESDDEYSE